ncbi:hypothetical protein TNCV_1659091 [Trichonephila clavipes]|nr:hypothetical protein TNCV_1659091 [Trichonephila clavipes]
MPLVRNSYQQVLNFDKSRILEYRNYRLSYRSINTRVGRHPMTVENGINELRTVIRNAVLDFNGPISLAAEKTSMLPA